MTFFLTFFRFAVALCLTAFCSVVTALNLDVTEPDESGVYQVVASGEFDRMYLYERPKGESSWQALTRTSEAQFSYQAENPPGEYQYRLLGCNYQWFGWWMTCNSTAYSEALVPDRVYMRVDSSEDFVFLTVNGVERLRWVRSNAWSKQRVSGDFSEEGGAPYGVTIDITPYFTKGENTVKIVATADSWGSFDGAYDLRIWKNNEDPLVYRDLAVSEPVSGSRKFQPLMLNEDLQLNIDYADQAKTLTVVSPQNGEAIYLNGVFSGQYTPASFSLPSGEYTVGLGAYLDEAGKVVSNPDWEASPPSAGEFYEGKVIIADSDVLLRKHEHLSQKRPAYGKRLKVAIQPYSEMHFGLSNSQAMRRVSASPDNIGVLEPGQEDIIRRSVNASLRTMTAMSYGQINFGYSLLPVTASPSYRGDNFATMQRAHQVANPERYDAILHVFPNINSQGDQVDNTGVAIGEKPSVYIPYTWLNSGGSSEGLVHELLHLFDVQRVSDFNGADQLHGAEEHGYTRNNHECSNSWQCYYAKYITSKIVANENTYRDRVQNSRGDWVDVIANGGAVPSPVSADTFVGVWSLAQNGFSENFGPSGSMRNQGNNRCLTMYNDSVTYNSSTFTAPCNGERNQQWTFKGISGDMYNLFSHDNLRCYDFRDGSGLRQNSICDSALEKRLTVEYRGDEFRVGIVDGRCIGLTSGGRPILQECDDNNLNQWWVVQ